MEETSDFLNLKIQLKDRTLELEHITKEFRELQNMSKLVEAELESELETALLSKLDLEKEINSLNSTNSRLASENSKLSKELENKSKELESKYKELESKTKELESKAKESASKSKELETRSKDLESKTKELESKSREIDSLRILAKSKNEDPDKKQNKQDEEIKGLNALNEQQRIRISELEKERKSLRDRVERIENDNAEKTREVEGLIEAKKELEKDKRILKKKCEKTELDLIAKSREQDDSSKKNMIKNQETLENLTASVKTLELENEKLKNRVTVLTKDSKEALASYQKSLRKIEAQEEEIEELKSRIQNDERNSRILMHELHSSKKKSQSPEPEAIDIQGLIDRTDEKDALYMIDNLVEMITTNISTYKIQ